MKKKAKKNQDVRFVRIRGRIVPIRRKKKDKASAAKSIGAVAAGTAIAKDAVRTKTVFVDKKNKIRIDKKTGVRASLSLNKKADELQIFKNGKKAGFANFSRSHGSDFTFNFLRIKKKFQGQGLSKPLTKQAAIDIKRKGGKTITNQVIHAGSVSTNLSKRDRLFQEVDFGGEIFSQKVSKKGAISELRALKSKRKSGIFTGTPLDIQNSLNKDSDIFRQTDLKGIRTKGKGFTKPFRTRSNKLKIAAGVAAVAYGFANAVKLSRKKDGRKK